MLQRRLGLLVAAMVGVSAATVDRLARRRELQSRDLVGVPGEDVGTLKVAGQVSALTGGLGWTQHSSGVPGKAEAGDRMGASLAEGLVGVPGENDGRGMVISGLGGTGPVTGFAALEPHAGDQFGAAVG